MDSGMTNQQSSKHSDLYHEAQSTTTNPKPATTNEQLTEHKPLVIQFKAVLKGLSISASLLPSLKAQYKVMSITIIKN